MFKIYLSGGMQGLSFEEQNNYRIYLTNEIKKKATEKDFDEKLNIFNPCDYYNYHKPSHESEKEIFMFELDNVRNSDLVIVNFNNIYSLGTMTELAIAYEHRIPILGVNIDENNKLHPWQDLICNRVFDTYDKVINYVVDYYLN